MGCMRHNVLTVLSDGLPHMLGELYAKLGRLVRPEQAARQFKDGSRLKMTLEEKMLRGRMHFIVKELGYLVYEGHVVLLDGDGMRRTYQLTEKGLQFTTRVLAQKNKITTPVADKDTERRAPFEVVECRKHLRKTTMDLVDTETELADLIDLLENSIDDALAVASYSFYTRTKNDAMSAPTDEQRRLGRRMIVNHTLRSLRWTRHISQRHEHGRTYIKKAVDNV